MNPRTRRPDSFSCEARYDRPREIRPGRGDDRDHSLTAPRTDFRTPSQGERRSTRGKRGVLNVLSEKFSDSQRGRTVSLAKRISNPRSRNPFGLSIAQCATSSFGMSLSTMNTATRMPTTTRFDSRICSRTSARRLILRRWSKSGEKRKGRERRKSCERLLKLLG